MTETRCTVFARTLYDGASEEAQRDMLIGIEGGRIAFITSGDAAGASHFADIVTPGLIDLQINGAADVQFNDDPTVDALARIAQGAAEGGTAHILPTFITAPGRDYTQAIAAARAAIEAGVPGILGLHLEGPFLSPRRPGIHDPAAIRPMDSEDIELLTQPFPGPLLLTVAPEELPEGAAQALTRAGVILFAGHSAATATEVEQAAAEGLSGATHLFNAMSQIGPREPGVVGAVLTSERMYAGIIADGHHVAWRNVALAARLMPDRLCLVTDAMRSLAGVETSFDLHGETIHLVDGRLTNDKGTLAGAHVAMDESLRNMIAQGIASPGAAVRMASHNPAAALGLQNALGSLRVGHRASLTLFDADMYAKMTICDGHVLRP
ncbi:N-acetylglucosamine-6-phosphate deacetylase [Oceanibium sediminis]|uniref:N-acetylglucosamine-6-phosphate deacetylase n=1 Tax=Oceanibium sediminis TaxID=2026339 RepID=UPI000DD3C178|nr:N-acetylglucosamine-6-phosphate deacetylase [Oceanibium sediminis]